MIIAIQLVLRETACATTVITKRKQQFCLDQILRIKEKHSMTDFDHLVAREMHNDNLSMQLSLGKHIGDAPNLVPWEDLSELSKEAVLWRATFVLTKLRAIGCDIRPAKPEESFEFVFTDKEIEKMAILEHDHWIVRKLKLGFVWGANLDGTAKPPTHPFLVPFVNLPEEQKTRDRDFCRKIPQLLARIGYVVERKTNDA